VISCAKYLDLVYSQTYTLYDLIPNALRLSTNTAPTLSIASHVVDGVIFTFHTETQKKQANHSNPKPTTNSVQNATPHVASPGKPLR
jgi:hypothetical protein